MNECTCRRCVTGLPHERRFPHDHHAPARDPKVGDLAQPGEVCPCEFCTRRRALFGAPLKFTLAEPVVSEAERTAHDAAVRPATLLMLNLSESLERLERHSKAIERPQTRATDINRKAEVVTVAAFVLGWLLGAAAMWGVP